MPPSPSLPFRTLVHSYIQTRLPLPPTHLQPDFSFTGSIPSSVQPSRDVYLRYRSRVLKSFPDWLNSPQEVVFSQSPHDGAVPSKERAIAKIVWTGTNTGRGGVLGDGHEPTQRRVLYRGIVWLERNQGDAGLSAGEVYGDLARFRRQLDGLETVSDADWAEGRKARVVLDNDAV